MQKENFLQEILLRRRAQVACDRTGADEDTLAQAAKTARSGKSPHRLRAALEKGDEMKIIGEFKRASPSLGAIRRDADLGAILPLYETAGVSAISILTEPDFFQGSLEDLHRARVLTALPILRKDFIIDEFQILETAAAGADALLLIAAALSDRELLQFRTLAEETFCLDALVEVHTEEEMHRAVSAGASLIGVNNRDLHDFTVSLEISFRLAPLAPSNILLVSESGISSPDQVQRLQEYGYRAVLMGESLMRAQDLAALLQQLRGRGKSIFST